MYIINSYENVMNPKFAYTEWKWATNDYITNTRFAYILSILQMFSTV